MNAAEIRQSFLEFFRERQHTIVPSSSLLPESPNLLFTNAGMNQFVPYFLGQATPPYRPPRAADTQKCIRAGGKHNDLNDVGFDTYHHTFFEMLGNWSFGDYFKKEAIAWAWELLVDRWHLPPARLYATVYQPGPGDPAAFDQEAYDHWAAQFAKAGLDPALHVVNGNRHDNFWMMGDTGPCGPCSEIHIDLTPAGDTGGKLVNQGNPLCIEIWNLVFIQFNANTDGSFSPLPAKHVDTGMGLDRVAGIVECTGGSQDFARPISNYECGTFRPIIERIAALSGKTYAGSLPTSRANLDQQQRVDVAFRVVADHLRALSFAIADGIIPGNTDRNYVVRRILRRAVMFGRQLGFGSGGFLSKLVAPVIEIFGDVFPELERQQGRLVNVLDTEEALFNRTLDRGLGLFEEELARQSGKQFSPAAAFKLYDTYGFPLDLTEVLAREVGLDLDMPAVETLMEQQRQRSRAAQEKEVITGGGGSVETEFVGFVRDEAPAHVVEVITQKDGTLAAVDRSPLYAEMGGQVSDTGELISADGSSLRIDGVLRQGRTLYLKVPGNWPLAIPAEVMLKVDSPRRRMIESNHTATHLLHWALHEVISPEVSQKGSYVGPDRLRFDFSSAPLGPEQLQEIEQLVNGRVIANDLVSWIELPYGEVRTRPDIMQFFGEKYGATVRVVQIGGKAGRLDGYSMELCGGTHVLRTGQIGLLKVISEGAISAGVRRIEALTGLTAYNHLIKQLRQKEVAIDELNQQLVEARKALEKERASQLQRQADHELATHLQSAYQAGKIVHIFDDFPPNFLQAFLDVLKVRRFDGVAVLFNKASNQVQVAAYVHPSKARGLHAGKVVQELTRIMGGKGGGRPDFAQGVGKDVSKLDEARSQAMTLV
jgi:alanyl-tRNA synthetase